MDNIQPAQMGIGTADITPDYPVELVGFFRPDNQSRGILHRLKVQAMVWKQGQETACLMAIDSLGFTVELSNLLRDKIAAVLHTGREQVMLCFSHTHSAPNAAIQPERYFAFVCEQAQTAVQEALADLSPALAAWGIGENNVGLNRRDEPENMDKRLGILRVTGADAQTNRALLLRVTAHNNVLFGDNYLLSADFFGVARDLLEETYGCTVLLIQGASGDIRPAFRQENTEELELHNYEMAAAGFSEEYLATTIPQSRAALRQMAASLGQSVSAVWDTLLPQPVECVSMGSFLCSFASEVPSLERAHEIAEEAKREAGIDGTDWLREVERLLAVGISRQHSDIEVQLFILGDGCICGTASEVMCRISLDIEREAGNPLLFFNGYTNGCSSYLPTAEEYDKGGYEVLWSNLVYFPYHGRVLSLERSTADKLVHAVVEHWRQFAGGTAPPPSNHPANSL